MGTSSAWPGPGGKRWRDPSQRLSQEQAEAPGAERRLPEIADSYLDALRQTCREDRDAFGLSDAAYAAGERLADAMAALADEGVPGLDVPGSGEPGSGEPGEAFLAQFTRRIGGEGTTVVDAALRRAATASGRRLLERTGTSEAPLSGDLLCLLYQWFFADLVTEFLRTAIAENIQLALPVLPLLEGPDAAVTEAIADKILKLVPSPCEEAALEADPEVRLPVVARRLVPKAVGRALGLTAGDEGGGEAAAA